MLNNTNVSSYQAIVNFLNASQGEKNKKKTVINHTKLSKLEKEPEKEVEV